MPTEITSSYGPTELLRGERYVRDVLPLLAGQQQRATARLPREVVDYYAGGSGDEVSLAEARRAWREVRLRPRVLRDVGDVDTSCELFGSRLATPVGVAPTALHALADPDGERATAEGARAAGALMVVSTRSSLPLEQIVPLGQVAPRDQTTARPWWLQVYVLRDRGVTSDLVRQAADSGASALVLTGDTPYVGAKARGVDLPQVAQPPRAQQDPTLGLDVIGWLAELSGLPVLVKGVLRGDDAAAVVAAGAAGVVVSNHGGRQLDRALATARALPEVVDAVAGRVPVLVDGGVRSGLDALCALALGARAVLLGRPVLWALAADGAAGVTACLRAVEEDLARCMALAGAATLADVTPDLVAP